MAVRKVEEEIERLGALRDAPEREAVPALARALGDRVNLIVGKAAAIAGERGLRQLVPDLLRAFARLLERGAQRDPQCRGKDAVARALVALDHRESAPYLSGVRHIQMEPVWGGQADTAANLRGTCVLALAACSDIPREETLQAMVDALADAADVVRVEAVRALTQVPGEEGALLLRLKARLGDKALQVTGQVFDGLLALKGDSAVPLVAGFLKDADEALSAEAALSLGASRLSGAVEALIASWEKSRDPERRQAAMRGLAVSRSERALDFLLGLVKDAPARDARFAIEALSVHRASEEIRRRVEAAADGREPEVRGALHW
jgi:HEAT repeat protein